MCVMPSLQVHTCSHIESSGQKNRLLLEQIRSEVKADRQLGAVADAVAEADLASENGVGADDGQKVELHAQADARADGGDRPSRRRIWNLGREVAGDVEIE